MENIDFSIFTTAEAWISLITLVFLEMVLGIDNLVFIAITTNRLPKEKQHIGRRLGLIGALVMRIVFLSFASVLIHMTEPLFTLFSHGFSIRDIVLLLGGVYLIYKGIVELRDVLQLTELKAEQSHAHKALHQIALPQAIITIMIMDLVFSIDSVITAVGLADHLIIMIIAVMFAVFMMIIFIDPIANFINRHPEMKILALTFIVVIGALLVLDGFGIHIGIELMGISVEKILVYFAMIFAIVLAAIQMGYNKNYNQWRKSLWEKDTQSQVTAIRSEMLKRLARQSEDLNEAPEEALEKTKKAASSKLSDEGITPVFIGENAYCLMPISAQDAASFKDVVENQTPEKNKKCGLETPIEISTEDNHS